MILQLKYYRNSDGSGAGYIIRLYPFAGVCRFQHTFPSPGAGSIDIKVPVGRKIEILPVFEKASRKFGLTPPTRSWLADGDLLVGVFGQFSVLEDHLRLVSRAVLDLAGTPGSFWWISLLLGCRKQGMSRASLIKILQKGRFSPLETLVILSGILELGPSDASRFEDEEDPGFQEEEQESDLGAPPFTDEEMEAALETLPPSCFPWISTSVFEALQDWGFAKSANTILRKAETLSSEAKILADIPPSPEGDCHWTRAAHWLACPESLPGPSDDVSDEMCQIIFRVAKKLSLQAISGDGRVLRIRAVASWFRKNPNVVLAQESDRIVQDGLSRVLVGSDAVEWLANKYRGVSLSGYRGRGIPAVGAGLATLIASEVLTMEERGKVLRSFLEHDQLLAKLARASTPAKLDPVWAKVREEDLLGYARAPVKMADLGRWLSCNGVALDIVDLEKLAKEVPKLVRSAVSGRSDGRSDGFSAWLLWLTKGRVRDEGKGAK